MTLLNSTILISLFVLSLGFHTSIAEATSDETIKSIEEAFTLPPSSPLFWDTKSVIEKTDTRILARVHLLNRTNEIKALKQWPESAFNYLIFIKREDGTWLNPRAELSQLFKPIQNYSGPPPKAIKVQPGQEIVETLEVSRYFDIAPGNKYEVFIYRNMADKNQGMGREETFDAVASKAGNKKSVAPATVPRLVVSVPAK